MGTGHSHSPTGEWRSSPRLERILWIAVATWAVVAVIGVIAYWPGDRQSSEFDAQPTVEGTVVSTEIAPCAGTAVEDLVECRLVAIELTSGPDSGERTILEQGVTSSRLKVPEVGDVLVLTATDMADGTTVYNFADYERSSSMWALLVLFVMTVVLLGRWRGAGAIAGLALSIAILVMFVLPALLDGGSPVVVAIIGASVIAFVSLYLAHGVNSPTNVALLSTLAALALTGLLAWAFIEMTSLTGLSDESALFLEAMGVRIDPRGLLLAGVVIGSLGVLDDVTVTQVAAVGELHRVDPDLSARELYRSALVIGRDHISSTVNTLFLAYAGAALPLLLLFTQVREPVGRTVTSEQVAVEVVRTLVGSIGLVAAVPISTGLAALVFTARMDRSSASEVASPTPHGA